MALRVALVTPFAWSQPHDVNEHVAGLARELRARGHSVTVLAPSNRARDLAAGRRALATGLEADFVALGHPGSDHYAGLETFANPGVSHVETTSDELSTICPVTGQPRAAAKVRPERDCLPSRRSR
jgi:hypothetical protein